MGKTGFVFGIRLKGFSLTDKLGYITESLLYNDKSEFNMKMFPSVLRANDEIQLVNKNNNNKFIVNFDNIIFEYQVDSDFNIEFDKYLNNFCEYIIDYLLSEMKISRIMRVGFVIKSNISDDFKLLKDTKSLIKTGSAEKFGSLNIKYNVLTPCPITIKKIQTEDYKNKIITIVYNDEENEYLLSVDYQKYFIPALNNIQSLKPNYKDFCKKSLDCYKKEFEMEG